MSEAWSWEFAVSGGGMVDNRVDYRIFNWGDGDKDAMSDWVDKFTQEYLFHYEQFNLKVDENGTIFGSVTFGENIVDEWFIVFLLKEISKRFECMVQVRDNDGEFLLIEGADFLPEWVSPDNAPGRVYIYQGCVHLVSPDQVPEGDDDIELRSRNYIKANPEQTKVRPELETEISRRYLSKFPQPALAENLHRFTCSLPGGCVNVLRAFPKLVPIAIHAFIHRPKAQDKKLVKVSYEGPLHSEQVVFTRCTFAQLMQQRAFPAPRVYGHIAEYDDLLELPTEAKSKVVGAMLASGLHLLLQNSQLLQVEPRINNLLATSFVDNLTPVTEDDPDTWMKLTPTEFEKTLHEHSQDDQGREKLEELVESLNEFIGSESDYTGIETTAASTEASLDVGKLMKLLGETNIDDNSEPNDDNESTAIDQRMKTELEQHPALANTFSQGNDDPQAVNMDMNLVQNLLESFASQHGIPGPASNLLGHLGFLKENEETS